MTERGQVSNVRCRLSGRRPSRSTGSGKPAARAGPDRQEADQVVPTELICLNVRGFARRKMANARQTSSGQCEWEEPGMLFETLRSWIQALGSTAASFCRDAATRRRLAREFAELNTPDLDRVLAEIGCTRADLSVIIANAPRANLLLGMMLERLGLEYCFAVAGAEMKREIERRCAACIVQDRCRRWLRREWQDEEYRNFCPNAANLELLRLVHTGTRPHQEALLSRALAVDASHLWRQNS